MKTGIDMSPQPSTSNSMENVAGMMAGTIVYRASAKEAIENDAAQVESSGADIGKWNCSIKRRTGSSENCP